MTPSDTPSKGTPDQIDVTAVEQGVITPVMTASTQTPEVYVAGKCAASLPRSPSEPANCRLAYSPSYPNQATEYLESQLKK
jgi:hypothetical protein